MSKRGMGTFATLGVFFWVCTLSAVDVRAETLMSDNYRFDESTLGAGGMVQASSANYQADAVLGDVAIGTAASANFQVQAGSKTSPDPTLSVQIHSSSANFGSFSPTTSSMATATFSVSNYTAFGYVVQLEGKSPSNGSRTIPALTTATASEAGKEQFGVNLVANTSPQSIGANPDQGQFGHGVTDPDYATPNKYHFVSGDTVASAPKSSGLTKFTLSYLVNVAPLTQGGAYKTNQTIIVVGTY